MQPNSTVSVNQHLSFMLHTTKGIFTMQGVTIIDSIRRYFTSEDLKERGISLTDIDISASITQLVYSEMKQREYLERGGKPAWDIEQQIKSAREDRVPNPTWDEVLLYPLTNYDLIGTQTDGTRIDLYSTYNKDAIVLIRKALWSRLTSNTGTEKPQVLTTIVDMSDLI